MDVWRKAGRDEQTSNIMNGAIFKLNKSLLNLIACILPQWEQHTGWNEDSSTTGLVLRWVCIPNIIVERDRCKAFDIASLMYGKYVPCSDTFDIDEHHDLTMLNIHIFCWTPWLVIAWLHTHVMFLRNTTWFSQKRLSQTDYEGLVSWWTPAPHHWWRRAVQKP